MAEQLIFLFIVIVVISAAVAGFSFAPWVPAWKKDLPRIFKLAQLKRGEIFYDLGCGNGKVVLYANKYFNAKAVGLEISLPLYFVCKIRQLFNFNENLKFKYKNLYKENLSDADAVYLFGMPDKMEKIRRKLEKELKPGSRVISYVFPVSGWEPVAIDKPKSQDISIYLYRI